MTRTWRLAATTVVGAYLALWPRASAAQESGAPGVSFKFPRIDAAVGIGWFVARADGDACCRWFKHSLFAGGGAGFYWTEHVKTEGAVGATSEDRLYFAGPGRLLNGRQYFVTGQQFLRTTRVQIAQVYQFGHNAWVHAFVGLGIEVERRHRRSVETLYPGSPPYDQPLPSDERASDDTNVLASALAGLKIYVSRRAFFRTDVAVKVRARPDEMLMRFGFGVDF